MDLAQRLTAVRERIAAACQRVGREPGSVGLVAVSKGQPPEIVDEAVSVGQLVFGENRVQEALAKVASCSNRATWHFIGHLQTNKCRDAVQTFDWIHSVDSLRLAVELDRWAERIGRRLVILLQVNIAREATKFGYRPETLAAELVQLNALSHLALDGLMTMAPWSPTPERARPVFRQLGEFKEECEAILGRSLNHLSMGMSGDFEVAIEEGSTLVRIGTSIFGERKVATR